DGGSWRRTLTLREPSADRRTLRAVLAPKVAELSAPVTSLGLELVELGDGVGRQLQLVRSDGADLQARLAEGLRRVGASVGPGAASAVVEVAPWSRLPEQRALLVPRDG